MFTKKAFTLTIGNESALLALHQGREVKNKVLIPSITEETKSQLLDIFKRDKSVPIYVLLDNSEQTYTNKTYPLVSAADLKQLINRYIKQEFENNPEVEVVHNHITNANKKIGKWECMYISSIYFEEMTKWINFILHEISNPLVGIYMLPVEAINLVKKIHLADSGEVKGKGKKVDKNTTDSDKVTLLIIQNKVSGVREIVYNNDKIIFTRLTNYDFESENFIVDFEQDIFRTNEYLKRLLPSLKIEDIEIINILPRDILEKIGQIKNSEINFINYTPREVSVKIDYGKSMPKGSQFGDVLIANVFVNSKKVLKTITPKIKTLSIFNNLSKVLLAINSILLVLCFCYLGFIKVEQTANDDEIRNLTQDRISTEKRLTKLKQEVVGDQTDAQVGIDEIIEFGIFEEMVEANEGKALEFFDKFNFLPDKHAMIKNFKFDSQYYLGNENNMFEFTVNGDINNESGNVENLFKIYDNLILETTDNFKGYNIVSSELPKDIDFSKQYHSVPFKITIKK